MKSTLIIVDTDQGFIQRFMKKLSEEIVEDSYVILPLIPDTTCEVKTLAERIASEIQSYDMQERVAGVFVDIVIYEKRALDTAGFEIVREIRKLLPNLPLFCITSKIRGEQEEQIFSRATLEDVEGVFSKDYLDGEQASSKRLRMILERGTAKRQARLGLVKANDEIVAQPNSIFLSFSYKEEDTELVSGLKRHLERSRYSVVTGEQNPLGSVSKSILKKIASCGMFIAVMTRRDRKENGMYTTSSWLLEEKGAALALGKKCLMLIEDEVDLSDIGGLQGDDQRLQFNRNNFASRVLDALEMLAG